MIHNITRLLGATALLLVGSARLAAEDSEPPARPVKKLILPGESFLVGDRPAFIFWPPKEKRQQPQPWIMYAATLPTYPDSYEKWMHEQFTAAGVAVAGIDVGEAYGSPAGQKHFTALYRELTQKRGFASRLCLLGRSRGGLWVSSWAIRNTDKVSGLAGIYPVFDLRTYPGLSRAAPAYGLEPQELEATLDQHNPIAKIDVLAKAKVPVFIIHGDVDKVVPLNENSATLVQRYKQAKAGDLVDLIVAEGQGHNYWPGFFHCQELVDFATKRAKAGVAPVTDGSTVPKDKRTQADNAAEASVSRPNIILVMADDLGWSDIGCYGGEIKTPHIDSLAQDGLRFTQFYNNAICGPTRASLLSGLYCQQIGHRGDRWNEPKDFNVCVTLGEVLRQAGYQTMMVGKWQGRDSALDRGFERFFGPMCQAKISYFHEVTGNPYYVDRERVELPEDFYLTDALNDYALRFLKESVSREKPFFLYVAHIAPHWPLHAREADVAQYRERYRTSGWDQVRSQRLARQRRSGLVPTAWKLAVRPAGIRDWKIDKYKDWQAERMAVYAAQVAAIDRGVGQLLQTLEDAGKVDNTLVMFLSDNGAAPNGGLAPGKSGFGFGLNTKNTTWRNDGEPIRPGSGPDNLPGPHDTFAAYGLAWANASNTPLRGTKLGAYEGGIRTPLLVRWPAVVRGGKTTRQPGHVIDFMATCLDVADVDYPTEFQGRKPLPTEGKSLLPIFHRQRREGHKQLCWSVPRHQAIRMDKWKAVRTRQGGTWQLFDLDADGTETTDLAQREPERVNELAGHFETWRKRVGAK